MISYQNTSSFIHPWFETQNMFLNLLQRDKEYDEYIWTNTMNIYLTWREIFLASREIILLFLSKWNFECYYIDIPQALTLYSNRQYFYTELLWLFIGMKCSYYHYKWRLINWFRLVDDKYYTHGLSHKPDYVR